MTFLANSEWICFKTMDCFDDPYQTAIVTRSDSVGTPLSRPSSGRQWRWSSLREGWRVSEMVHTDELAEAQLPTTTDTGGDP